MSAQNEQPEAGRWYVPEAIATWFVPGLGHYLLGEKQRGIVLFVSVFSIWFLGLLIGGIAVFDQHAPSAPIIRKAHYGMASSLFVEYARTNFFQEVNLLSPEQPTSNRLVYTPPLNRMEEQGVLFAAIAGLLNLMLVIDVVYRVPRHAAKEKDSSQSSKVTKQGAPS